MYLGSRKKNAPIAVTAWLCVLVLVMSMFGAAPAAWAQPQGTGGSKPGSVTAQNAPAEGNGGSYVVGSEQDPWPNLQGDNPFSGIAEAGCEQAKIAVMFDFAGTYTWETMGGVFNDESFYGTWGYHIPNKEIRDSLWRSDKYDVNKSERENINNWGTWYNGKPYVRRMDQAQQLEDAISKLKGSPTEVGIYTFSQFDTRGGNGQELADGTIVGGHATGNTPDLPATSLATKDGYERVVEKIRSLDATNPMWPGQRREMESTSDWMWAFKKMAQHVEEYGYTDVFLISVGRSKQPAGRVNPYAQRIIDAGAKIHVLEMGPAAQHRGDVFANLSYKDPNDPYGQACAVTTSKGEPAAVWDYQDNPRYGRIGGCEEKRISYTEIKHPDGGYDIGGYYDQRISRQEQNDVRDGKFSDEINKVFYRKQCMTLTSQVMDGEKRYMGPRAGAGITATYKNNKTGRAETHALTTNEHGAAQLDPGDNVTLLGVTQTDPHDPQRDYASTPYTQDQPLRCIGYAVGKQPEPVHPSALQRAPMPDGQYGLNVEQGRAPITIGTQDTSGASGRDYSYVVCGFYSRPMQDVTYTKVSNVDPSPMGYDTIGSTFELGYTCEDPLDVGDPANAGTLDAARIYREPGDTPGAGEVPNPYSVTVDKQLQTQSVLAENVKLTRMPLGATCKVQEKVTLPPKYTDRNDPLYSSMEADRIFNSNTQYTGYGAKITSTEGKNDPATGTPIPNPSEYNSEAVLTVAPAQGNASNINSRTTFTMNKAKIKLRMRVESEGGTPPAEVLGSIEKIPVQLTCRYMSDPANPPETLKGVPFFPGMVISDVVGVPVHAVDTGDPAAGYIDFVQSEQKAAADPALGLEATALDRLATFPVGTHCVISTDIPENAVGYDPVEDGPTLAEQLAGTGWTQAKQQINSDMCAGDYQKYQKGGEYYGNMFRADGTPIPVGERDNTPLPQCSDNYTYLHSGDQQWVENPTASGVEMRLELVETIKRQENTVNITNLAGGDAAGEIMRLPTPMTGTLKCTPQGGAAGEELYERTFEIKPGTQDHALPVSFTDVPGDSTCEVSLNPSAELDQNPNLEAVQYPAAKRFEVKANDVDITLETVANYKRAPLIVTHRSVAGAGLTTPEGEGKVDAQVKQITAKCKRPDGSEVDPISVEVTNDRTGNPVEKVLTEADGRGLPYGTVCSFSTEYPNLPSDVIGKAVYDNGSAGTPSGPKNRVTVGDGAKMNITSTFNKVEANIMARVANEADNFNPADSPFLPYIDDAAKLRFECPGQEPVDIYVYDAEPIDVLPVDTDCTVTLLDPQAGGDESAGVVPYTVSTEVEFYVQNPGEAKPASQPVALAPGESYTFRSPAQGSQGFLSFRNTFSILKKDVNLNVSMNATVPTEKQGTTTATIWEADGAGMDARWVQALEATPASEALWLSYRCYYSETPGEALSPERLYNPKNPLQIAVEGSQRLGENLNATVPVTIKDVPRGATCEFRIAQGAPDMAFAPINAENPVAAAAWELFDAAKLDATNSPGFYHGADVNHSAGNASPGVYTINDYGKSAFLAVTGDAAQPSEMNYKLTYDMLPAQFNVKMKVKGDGVAQVLPTKLLDTKFRCTLNGVPVTSGRTYEANPAGVWNDPQQTPEKLLDTEPVDPNGWSTLKASRFAVGAIPNQIAGIPAGAECEAFQTEASARIDDTSWVPTWEAGTGPMSRGVESRAQYTELAEPSGATSEAKGGYLKGQDGPVIKFQLPTKVTAPAGNVLCDASADGQGSGETCASVYGDKVGPVPPVAERFYGTITPWSEYTFNKTQLVIRKSFSGDGKELAENNDYRVHLTCYQDPDKVMVGDDELPTNQEQFEKTLELKKSGNHTAVFELLVPVHYTCTVSEFAAPTYDAKAETAFSSPSKINATETLPVTPQDPGVGQVARAAFVTNPALGGRDENGAQRVTVIDSNSKYERLRAALAVLIERDDKSTDGDYVNVGPGVGVESYDVEYDCVDPYLKDGDGQPRRYSGTVQAGNGQGPVEIKPAPNPEYDGFDSNSPQYLDLPAAAKCTITQQFQRAEGQAPGEEPKNPLDAYVYSPDSGRRNVQLDSQITISKLVDTEPYLTTEKVLGTQDGRNLDNVNARPLTEKELKLSAGETTAVTFENRYQLRTANYSFGTVLEGLEGLAEIDGHQVDVTSLPFNFDVSCEYPNMPQNSTFAASGTPLNERFATHQNPAPENPDAKAVPAGQATNMWTKLVPEGTACTVKPDFGEDAIAQMPKDIAMKLAGAGFRWDPTVVTKPAALRDGAGDIVLNPDLRGVERQPFTAAEALTLNADTPEQVIAYKLAYTDASELPMTGVPGWRLCFLALMLGLVAAALVLTYRSTAEPLCATRTRANTNSRSTFGSDIRSQNRNERKRE